MRKIFGLSCSVVFLLPMIASAQDKAATEIINKAIKAHGGIEALAKHKGYEIKGKGTLHIQGGLKFSGTFYFLAPDKLRQDFEFDINGMTFEQSQAFDGKKFWIRVQGKVIDLNDKKVLEAMKEGLYAERVSSLVDLHKNKKKYKLSPLGEIQVNNKAAVGVRVTSEGYKDISLYFDKKSYYLVQMEHNAYDLMANQEVQEVKIMSKYTKVKGVPVPGRLDMKRDGKQFLEIELSSYQTTETFDASLFARPD